MTKMRRELNNTSLETARANVPDMLVHGDPNAWICIAKASSKAEGFMASTKVMNLPNGALIESLRREYAEASGFPSVAVSVALAYVPDLNVHKEGDRYEWHHIVPQREREDMMRLLQNLEIRTAELRAELAKMDEKE